MVKNLKRKTKDLIESKNILGGVFTASFLESTIVPIPLEALLIPLLQKRRDKLWQVALMATMGCITGALLGYALGYYTFELLRDWIVTHWITEEKLDTVMLRMKTEGFWFVMTLGVAPIPFQIAMLAAGATQFSLLLFLLATGLSRAIRYFGIALVVYIAGDKAEKLIKKYKLATLGLITSVLLAAWYISTSAG
ncbi:VTT domain-containing protein [Vibrio sp. Isolate24]|uniref:YqaA family protein n=1 Tax=Vibrio sp. Isolate24 TaxID=2908534 RepID=UPI001EFDB346|nr:VTT domain-containing protein [Vibrio sp. Isolate24]MCG9678283.1 VTT domain-containing protein [Vibrio sp. Isolate24]